MVITVYDHKSLDQVGSIGKTSLTEKSHAIQPLKVVSNES
jgi:hypothetical protein